MAPALQQDLTTGKGYISTSFPASPPYNSFDWQKWTVETGDGRGSIWQVGAGTCWPVVWRLDRHRVLESGVVQCPSDSGSGHSPEVIHIVVRQWGLYQLNTPLRHIIWVTLWPDNDMYWCLLWWRVFSILNKTEKTRENSYPSDQSEDKEQIFMLAERYLPWYQCYNLPMSRSGRRRCWRQSSYFIKNQLKASILLFLLFPYGIRIGGFHARKESFGAKFPPC